MRVMGILNLTPDSFSDGGRLRTLEMAVARAYALVEEGADCLDLGGESTRPGAQAVPPDEERARVVPVIRALRGIGVPISVDTRRAAVAAEALEAGATIVNDVSGGADPAMWPLVAEAGCEYVLMHTRGDPAIMMAHAHYDDVEAEVWGALDAALGRAVAAGVDPERVWLDPGIGFAKTTEHNLRLLRTLDRHASRRRVLLGASRKRFLGELGGNPVASERRDESVAVALHAADCGVDLVRVHDVAATVRALKVWSAIRGVGS